jgi:cell division protein FtsN
LETSLRNRLTGAIILIVIAVALLPELLTGAGSNARSPMADDPARAGPPVVNYNIDLTGTTPRPAVAETETPAAPVALPVPPAAATVDPAAQPKASPAPVAEAAPAQPAPTPTPPAQSASAPPAAPAAAAATQKFVVQVGSFRDRKAADARAQSLKVRKFDVTVSSNGATPPMYRVRVGAAGDREAAEKIVKRLKVVKVDGSIVPAN